MTINTEIPNLEYSSISIVAKRLQEAFHELKVSITTHECELLSCFLNDVYGTRNRAFHDVNHALTVGKGCSPLGVLAGLMHDAVYLQVDRAHLPDLRTLFGIFDPGEKIELILPSEEIIKKDVWAQAIVSLFGFTPGQKLGVFSGLNEFLSGWIALKKLSPYLKNEQLIHILANIEATIPFRGNFKNPSVPERLKSNIKNAAKILKCEMSDAAIDQILKESIAVSNNDVEGFGLEEPQVFIYNSWALLYESNPTLQNNYFSIVKYREALQRLEGFLSTLNPTDIFLQYNGYPDQVTFEKLIQGAAKNIRIAREYIQVKLLETAVIESIAFISGGDCPLEFFTGPKPTRRESKSARIEQFLDWQTINADSSNKDESVIQLLDQGRAFRSKFDIKTALFASYIYLGLTPEQFKVSYTKAVHFFKREVAPEEFLSTIPDAMMFHIGEIISHIAWTRAEGIERYVGTRKITR